MFLNDHVKAVLRGYPTDGSHPYYWPEGAAFDGVTRELFYKGRSIAHPDEQKRTYCCGLTFEVWLTAISMWAGEEGKAPLDLHFDAGEMVKIKAEWFVATGGRGGPVDALVKRGLAIQIEKGEEAREGDFVQLWRKSGSGHSVIFLERKIQDDMVIGFKYWSTQKS